MKPLHILLVEDNEADIFYAREVLEDAKIVSEINVVRDGKQAIDFLFVCNIGGNTLIVHRFTISVLHQI